MAARFSYLCAALSLLSLASLPRWAAADTVIGFGDCAWRWKVIPAGVVCMTAGCDDSAWPVGCAPFGMPWACSSPATLLASEGSLIMRRHVFNPGGDVGANIVVRTQGYAEIWVDGAQQSWGGPQSDCPPTFTLTASQTLHHGDNVIVIYSRQSSGSVVFGGWIDAQVSVDGVTPTLVTSWGRLKLYYR